MKISNLFPKGLWNEFVVKSHAIKMGYLKSTIVISTWVFQLSQILKLIKAKQETLEAILGKVTIILFNPLNIPSL